MASNPRSRSSARNGFLAGAQTYLNATRKPVYSLWIVLPFALMYLGGMFYHHVWGRGSGAPFAMNYGDSIIQKAFYLVWEAQGVYRFFPSLVSALVLAASFIVWHFARRAPWKTEPGYIGLMFIESLFFAIVLQLLDILINAPARSAADAACAVSLAAAGGHPSGGALLWRNLVVYCGAGVFEELVFRVFLVGALILFFQRVTAFNHKAALADAAILGAILFTLVHYQPVNAYGEPFRGAALDFWRGFSFRFLAGVLLAYLCHLRAFGIAVGAHAFYNILIAFQRFAHGT
jgi:hypothetical protein